MFLLDLRATLKLGGGSAMLGCVMILTFAGARAANAEEATLPTEITLPAPTGPYSVGRAVFEWMDADRDEIHSSVEGQKRELLAWVWCPTDASDSTPVAAYMPGPIGIALAGALGLHSERIHVKASEGGAVAGGDAKKYPILIFSHGSGSLLAVYSAMQVELASHGYVVVGIQHTYNAMVTPFADGRAVAASPDAVKNDTVQYWADDTAFVVDTLEQVNGENGVLAGHLDLSRIGVLGHSFGGAAAAEFCLNDRRCVAGLNFDGSYSGNVEQKGVARPFMQLFADTSCEDVIALGAMPSLEECRPLFARFQAGWQKMFEVSSGAYRLTIQGARHSSFSDLPFYQSQLPPRMADGATINPERAWRIASDYALAFFDTYLRGENSKLLTSDARVYDEVIFERRGK